MSIGDSPHNCYVSVDGETKLQPRLFSQNNLHSLYIYSSVPYHPDRIELHRRLQLYALQVALTAIRAVSSSSDRIIALMPKCSTDNLAAVLL